MIRALAVGAALTFAASADAPARERTARPLLVTVDDLPIAGKSPDPAERERITTALLAALAKHDIRAVGLVTWSNVRRPSDEKLLERWLAAGHELGNHTHGHLDYTRTESSVYIADVERGRAELAAFLAKPGARRAAGGRTQPLRFFRFSYLREGDTPAKLQAMRDYLQKSGQRNLAVTIDNSDWSFDTPWVEATRRGDRAALDSLAAAYHDDLRLETADHEAFADDMFERQTPQILLLHANAVGAAQWERLFDWFAASGHRFATADEVLADSAFAPTHDYVGRYGCSLWHRLADERRRDTARAAIQKLLDDSARHWNAGDLEAFCADYAEDALFVSSSGTTRGRQAVLDRYRAKYKDKAAMGTLSFELVEIRLTSGMGGSVLGSARPAPIQGASVAARWTLRYPDRDTATGSTLLVLRPRGGGAWEIVQDASM
jgi:peptidoglycan/xylan/chitin deacetylase (PgdA/CDA1 family)/ketosteroid isomerase-like protein